MEIPNSSVVLITIAVPAFVTIALWAWRVANWVWLRPRKIEKCLREQGFKGNPYRIFYGDTKEMKIMGMNAISKPINLSDDIRPRVLPFHHHTIIKYALVTFLTLAWKALNWVWLRPKQIERCLRDQGFKGNAYRFLYGDTKEIISAIKEARSKPLEASDDDIVSRILSFHRYFVNIHGMNYFTWLGPTPRLNIADPKLIKEILSNYEVFQKPAVIKSVLTGILALEGEKWAKHRKLINPAFQLEKLKLMVPAMYSSCSEMISKWEVLVSTEGFCEVDVWPYLSNLTADVISGTAFGSNYEEGKLIFQLLKEQSDTMQRLQSISIPGWRFLPTKTNKKKKQIHDELGALLHNIINKRRGTVNGEDGGGDLLGILLTSNLKDIDQEQLGNKKSVKLTTEEVIEECKLFYLAGQETTANLLVWTMVLLSKNQKWQTLAREEILAVCGDNRPDFDALKHLKTVTMILHEALRLYPPGPAFTRVTHKKTKLGELVIPAGVEIFMPIMEVHYDPKMGRRFQILQTGEIC